MQLEQRPENMGQIKALSRGLEILRLLVEANGPMSATEIGVRMNLHQSSVSRILATLSVGGYVRKADYRSFEPDFGVLGLGLAASTSFALTRPRAAMLEAAEMCSGLQVSLCVLWREEMIYFLRTSKGVEPIVFSGGYPLHMSSPALRFMVDMPEDEALSLLRASRRRYGWPRPTEVVPETEEQALAAARERFQHECIILDGWVEPHSMSAAINLHTTTPHPTALALSGPRSVASDGTIRLWLHEIRRSVEAALDNPA